MSTPEPRRARRAAERRFQAEQRRVRKQLRASGQFQELITPEVEPDLDVLKARPSLAAVREELSE